MLLKSSVHWHSKAINIIIDCLLYGYANARDTQKIIWTTKTKYERKIFERIKFDGKRSNVKINQNWWIPINVGRKPSHQFDAINPLWIENRKSSLRLGKSTVNIYTSVVAFVHALSLSPSHTIFPLIFEIRYFWAECQKMVKRLAYNDKLMMAYDFVFP